MKRFIQIEKVHEFGKKKFMKFVNFTNLKKNFMKFGKVHEFEKVRTNWEKVDEFKKILKFEKRS